MTAPGVSPVAPVALRDRALAPDVARGAMLLLIALANVHLYLYDRPLGVRLYPAGLTGADAVVAGLQMVLVDGRAYPLFGLLLGYGLGQLAARSAAAGSEPSAVVRLIRRRGWWMVAIGVAHVVLLWSGDIVAAYGLLTADSPHGRDGDGGQPGDDGRGRLRARRRPRGVLGVLAAWDAPLLSIAVPDPVTAAVLRLGEWAGGTLIGSLISVVGAVALGVWAARHRILDEPAAHRRLLGRLAVAGLVTGCSPGCRSRSRPSACGVPVSACSCSRGPCTPWAGTRAGWATRRRSGWVIRPGRPARHGVRGGRSWPDRSQCSRRAGSAR